MSNDKMRESAEDFYKVPFEKMDVFMQRAWEACWQASREALVIELPDVSKLYEHAPFRSAVEDCRYAIEAAGVKVKL